MVLPASTKNNSNTKWRVFGVEEVRAHTLRTAAPEVALKRLDKGQFFLFKRPHTRAEQVCRYDYFCSCFTGGGGGLKLAVKFYFSAFSNMQCELEDSGFVWK
jgi:hypothetical protein